MRKIFGLLLLGVSLAACTANPGIGAGASLQADSNASALERVANFTVADLQAADADAMANNDAIAHACYPNLIKFVESLPSSKPGTTVVGAFSAFQKARDLRNAAAGGVPDYLTLGCGPLYAQVHGDLLLFLTQAH